MVQGRINADRNLPRNQPADVARCARKGRSAKREVVTWEVCFSYFESGRNSIVDLESRPVAEYYCKSVFPTRLCWLFAPTSLDFVRPVCHPMGVKGERILLGNSATLHQFRGRPVVVDAKRKLERLPLSIKWRTTGMKSETWKDKTCRDNGCGALAKLSSAGVHKKLGGL